ncbi:hypothetical protein ACFRJ9_14850 [Paenarthrobacter sp. NPDC056912]|uniref:hypothetical protein n=1 Tax=Paenarthrobacter sp. NPDC056912 TaxID=3345965 RepID=UPI00366C038C
MNQLSPDPHDSQPTGPDTTAGTATSAGGNAAGNPAPGTPGSPAKYEAVVGPFTIRDLTVFGSTLLMFVASLLPMFGARYNLWNLGNLFFLLLGIILPLVVVALFVARRLQPGTILRVGSLSIDQFASVTASFAFPLFFLTIANSFNGSVLLGLVGSAGLLAATVLAPYLPWLSADFKGRVETPAHVVAREAAVPSRKPAAPKAPKPSAATPAAASAPGFQASNYQAAGSSDAGTPTTAGAAAAGVFAASAAAGSAPTAGAPASTSAPSGVSGSTGASSFAPPADSGMAPSQASGTAAVVTSPDSAPTTGATPAGAAPATAQVSDAATSPEPEAEVKEAAAAGEPAKAPTAEPATTQHATTQHATQQPVSEQPAASQPVSEQPAAAQQPAASQPAAERPWAATMATPIVSRDTRAISDSIGATVDPASRPDESNSPAYEAFWFAVAQPRTAYDEQTGTPAFTVEPGGWVLALEDRGHEFLVQDTDGKVGVLRELSNIERG